MDLRALKKGRLLSSFKKGDTIHVSDKMQKYTYVLDENPGENLAFKPYTTPGEILALGAFGGKYLNDGVGEFPAEWFWNAGLLEKLSEKNDTSLNYFEIDSRLPLSEWRKNGWVPGGRGRTRKAGKKAILADPEGNPDIRGWFQWYCRYWMGRRLPELDAVQIQRWKNFKRHYAAVKKNCTRSLNCRPRQRQALLHWAWKFD